jgi:hypothetical protein
LDWFVQDRATSRRVIDVNCVIIETVHQFSQIETFILISSKIAVRQDGETMIENNGFILIDCDIPKTVKCALSELTDTSAVCYIFRPL